MAADRVERYHTDCEILLKLKNPIKISSEIKKLCQWIQKHQSETIPDNHKQIQFATIESYYNYYILTKDPVLLDPVTLLVDDCLKLPEGKLTNSKNKKKALKWLGTLNVGDSVTKTASGSSSSSSASSSAPYGAGVAEGCDDNTRRYVVIEVREHNRTISVVDEETRGEHVIDEVHVTSATQWKALKKHTAAHKASVAALVAAGADEDDDGDSVFVHLSAADEITRLVIDGKDIE